MSSSGRAAACSALLAAAAALLAAACSASPAWEAPRAYVPPPADFQRGMNLEPIRGFGRTLDLDLLPRSLDALVELGVDHVAIVPSFFQRRLGDRDLVWRGGRATVERETRAAIRMAHERGLAVLLKPHLWLEDRSGGAWRGDIDPDAETWPAWRRAYGDAVLGFARLAAEESVAGISIGSELRALTASRPEFWGELAADVREVFPGFLTYAANWHEEFDRIAFWPELDYIGVDAFWPLVDDVEERLTAASCAARMGAIRDALAKVAARTGRPVLFTEIGYKSSRGALWQPWEWEGDEIDLEAQAAAWDCIAHVLGTAATSDGASDSRSRWLQGVYGWNWHADLRYGGTRNTDFTVHGKPAEAILGAWFRGR